MELTWNEMLVNAINNPDKIFKGVCKIDSWEILVQFDGVGFRDPKAGKIISDLHMLYHFCPRWVEVKNPEIATNAVQTEMGIEEDGEQVSLVIKEYGD